LNEKSLVKRQRDRERWRESSLAERDRLNVIDVYGRFAAVNLQERTYIVLVNGWLCKVSSLQAY
jgi:sulfur carrier protein ThiS